jgi:hypothetical protein
VNGTDEIVFAGYRYEPHKGVFICQHVFDGAEVRLFTHERDGDLVIGCGEDGHGRKDWKLAGLNHVVTDHPELLSLPTVNPGSWADRRPGETGWVVNELGPDDD